MTLKEAVTAVLKDVAQTGDYETGVEDIMTLLKDVKKTENTLSICEMCGIEYETYPIIVDNNPLSVASVLEDETKKDGSKRNICKKCRKKVK